jgi:hypothetical protein
MTRIRLPPSLLGVLCAFAAQISLPSPSADEVNDLDGVARSDDALAVLGARNDSAIDFDRDRPPGELKVLKELPDGHPIGDAAFFSVERHDHRRRI